MYFQKIAEMSRSGGRKKDPIWQYFIEKSNKSDGKTGSRATCKKCKFELQGIVERMKKHWEVCQKTEVVQTVILELDADQDADTDSSNSASASTSTASASTCSGLDLNVSTVYQYYLIYHIVMGVLLSCLDSSFYN